MNNIRFSELSTFTAKQREASAVADAHRYTLYGGSRGPGKSHWLRWYAVRRLLRWAYQGHMGVQVGLFCEDYPSLRDRQISKIAQFPQWLGELRTSKENGLGFHLWPQYGNGVVLLRNLDDATKYQSVEFAGILIDELTKNSERTFDELRGSLRWPGISDVFFAAATNPNGRYFKWVRRYWIEGQLPPHLEPLKEQFAYVKALPADNPHLDAQYWETLNALPDRLRRAWRDGDWYVAVEGLVYDTFSEANIVNTEPDPELPFEIAIDDGYIDPRATLFIQKQADRILVFDELYQTKTLEEQTIADILERGTQYGGKPELAAVSHEAVALQRRLREADIPARNWLAVRAGGRTTSTRGEAIKLTRALFCDGVQYRTLQVHRRCRNLLDEITTGYRNKEGPDGYEDVPDDGNDHACNALESWVWLRARRYSPSLDDANTEQD